jgi:hypothetical protein
MKSLAEHDRLCVICTDVPQQRDERDSSVLATNRQESTVGRLFASVNTLHDILNPELNKQFWEEHTTVSLLAMLQSTRRRLKKEQLTNNHSIQGRISVCRHFHL